MEGHPSLLLLADVGSEMSGWQGSLVVDGVHLGFQSLGSCTLECPHAWPPAAREVAAPGLIYSVKSKSGCTGLLKMCEEFSRMLLCIGSPLMAESRNSLQGSPRSHLLVYMLALFLGSSWEQKGCWQHLSCAFFDVGFRTKSQGSALMAESAF